MRGISGNIIKCFVLQGKLNIRRAISQVVFNKREISTNNMNVAEMNGKSQVCWKGKGPWGASTVTVCASSLAVEIGTFEIRCSSL